MQEKNKSAFTTSKITWKQKKRGLQRQNLRERKNIGVYNVKIYVRKKNRRLQRQNLRENKKIGVYNVTDNVNQNRTRQLKHRRPIIEGAVWTKI